MSFASNDATDEPTAIFIAHWPGEDVAVCLNHLEKLQQVGAVMGFSISATQCEPTICSNCQNETKHKQQV